MNLPLLLLLFAQEASLSGTVVNSVTGEPLNRVELVAEPTETPMSRVPLAVSNADGKFTFKGLPPGRYRLKGVRNGYLDTYHRAPITLAAGEDLRGLRLKLLPPGVIAGTVRDADGEPLVRTTVTLYQATYEKGRRRISPFYLDGTDGALTDDRGEYRIAGLPAGTYYVRASPRSNLGSEADNRSPNPIEVLLPSLYPGTVEIGPGARVTGIDIALPRSKTVHVKGHASAPAGANLTSVYLTSDPEEFGIRIAAQRDRNGDFDIRGVPPGSYRLVAMARTPATPSSNYLDLILSQRQYRSSMPILVGASPLEGLRLEVTAPAQVTGTITIEGSDKDRKLPSQSSVGFDDRINEAIYMPIKSDLTFFAGLTKGHYSVSVHTLDDLVIRRVNYEGRDVLREGLTISDAAPLHLEIVLAPDGGRVEGVVVDREDKPVEGATVVLIPSRNQRFRAALFRQFETDQHGRYTLSNVPPGEYSLFAWTGVEPGIWWDPEFLQAQEVNGRPIIVTPQGQETVKLEAIRSPRGDP